jgi:hypothetical protein
LKEKIPLNVIQLDVKDVNKLLGRAGIPDKIAKALVFLLQMTAATSLVLIVQFRFIIKDMFL